MFYFAVCTLVSIVFGCLLVWCCWPGQDRPWLLVALVSLPVGLSLTSAMFFLWLVISGGKGNWYPMVECGVLVATLSVAWKFRRDIKTVSQWGVPFSAKSLFAILVVLAAVLPVSIAAFMRTLVNPWGRWDAWARINVKAHFLFGGGDGWTWIFESPHIAHNDYPLLLAATVARAWSWMGVSPLFAPQAVSLLWGLWSVLILYGLVAWLRGVNMAAIATLAYLTFTPLWFFASIQYSDIALACYLLLGCAMMYAAEKYSAGASRFAGLAGFFAGSAAWCKNEGIVFLALVLLWWAGLVMSGRICRWRSASVWLFGGLASVGCAVVVLKLFYASSPGVLAGRAFTDLWALVVDSERHLIILGKFVEGLVRYWYGWPLLLVSLAFILKIFAVKAVIDHVWTLSCVFFMMASYYFVYVITSNDLVWHLNTTINRLVMQLWPAFILGIVLLFSCEDKTSNNLKN